MACKSKDIDSICRVCMKTSNLKSIFKFKDRFNDEYEDLSSKLSSCGGVDIRIDDNLPHKICEVCSDTLILAYDFQTLCKSTDAFLKNTLYHHKQEKNDVEFNAYEKSTEIFKDIKQTKTFAIKKEILDSDEDVNKNYEDTSLNNDVEGNSDSQIEDDINVSLHSGEVVPVEGTKLESDAKKYKCYACDTLLPTRWDRQLHEDLECPLMPPGTIYKCRNCPATAPDRDKFDNHIRLHHRGTSPPAKNLPNVTKPVKKNKTLTDGIRKDIICEQCGMQIKNIQNYKIHCLRHKGKYWLNCKQCPFKTTNSYSYSLHMKYYHMGHEFLKCPHCTFTTHRKGNLNIHLRRHTGERPYPCNMCDYKAINHSNLKKHMTKHTNYKGFVCKICGCAYASNKSLKEHTMRVHENMKTFYCKPCHKNFIGDEAFNRHLQRKHGATDAAPAQTSDT